MNAYQKRASKRAEERDTELASARVDRANARTCAALGVYQSNGCATCPRECSAQAATQTSQLDTACKKTTLEDRIITTVWWGLAVYSVVCAIGVSGYLYQVWSQS